MDEKKRTKRNLWFYPLGTVGRDIIYQLFANYLLTFVMFTRDLTAAQLAAITAIMVAARIFDALNDPLMGNIIERTRTRWGKFKPWLVIGILSTSFVVIFLFNNTLQGWPFVIAFGVCYFLYSITYTMHDISYWGMVPALSEDADTRNQFTSRASLFAGLGVMASVVLIPMFSAGSKALGGSARSAYGIIAIIASILAPLFLAFTIFGVRENRSYESEPAPKVSFKKIISVFAKNDQLKWIAIIFILQQIGNGIVMGGIGSMYIYFDFGYEGSNYGLFSAIGMMATGVLMILYPVISRKMNRKPLLRLMMILGIIGYALMLFPGLFMEASSLKFWLLTIGYMLSNAGQYCFYLVMMISIFNTVEYNELKFGTRDEAIITSLRPFITKLASALIVVITTVTYLIFGVNGVTNSIDDIESKYSAIETTSDEEAAALSEQKAAEIDAEIALVDHSATVGLLFTMTVLPCILMMASYFLYAGKYKLDEAEYERIRKELEARKASDGAASEA